MRFYHLVGGLVLSFAAAGLGALFASAALAQLGRPNDAQAAWEIGLVFFLPFAGPALFTLLAIARGRQERRLRAAVDQHARTLAIRQEELRRPNCYGAIETTRWSDEVWRFRRGLPHRLPLLDHRAALRIVTERLLELDAAQSPAPSGRSIQPAFARFVGAELIRLGWRAKLLTGKHAQDVHILAQKRGIRVVALCCPLGRVGNALVERALAARTHAGADLAAIVAQGDFDAAAQTLARHTGVGLLHPRDIARIQRAAGRVWRVRRGALLLPQGAARV